jgi:hypothetical protein
MTAQPNHLQDSGAGNSPILYFVETTFNNVRGRAFIECDRDTNSRAHIIGLIRTGEVNPVKILEVIEDEGTCRDVTADILAECDAINYSHALNTSIEFVQDAIDWQRDHARDDLKVLT